MERRFTPVIAGLGALLWLAAHASAVVVSPGDLQGWQQVSSSTASGSFINGPAAPPLGVGSYQLSVGSDGDAATQLRLTGYDGVALSSLTELSYSTYVTSYGSGGQAPYLILNLDNDASGSIDDFLFFEPVYQDGTYNGSFNQGTLTTSTWQGWDALSGGWWSSGGLAGLSPGTGIGSLSTYLASFPNSVIRDSGALGGVRIVAGFGAPDWNNAIGSVDAFGIGAGAGITTYDFELTPIPEPGSLALVLGGVGLLALRRRRR